MKNILCACLVVTFLLIMHFYPWLHRGLEKADHRIKEKEKLLVKQSFYNREKRLLQNVTGNLACLDGKELYYNSESAFFNIDDKGRPIPCNRKTK